MWMPEKALEPQMSPPLAVVGSPEDRTLICATEAREQTVLDKEENDDSGYFSYTPEPRQRNATIDTRATRSREMPQHENGA